MNNTVSLTQPRPWTQGIWRVRQLFGDPIPKAEWGLFFDSLATLLSTGMSIPEAVRRASHSLDPELRAICEAAAGPVSAGVPLHRALEPWRDRLPEIVLPVLEVGEVSGTLESAARRLAVAFNQAAGIERRFRYSVFDPWLVILLLPLYSVPYFVISAPSLLVVAQRTIRMFLRLVVLYLVGRLICRWLFRWQPLRLAVDTVKLALPHMGIIARNLAAARWARSFATLWHSGVPISSALEVSSRSALNAHYERALQRAAQQTRQGRSLSESLAETQLLPAYLLDIIRTGEMSGNPGRALEQLVHILEDEAMTMATQEFVAVVSAVKIVTAVAMVAVALY